MLPSCYFSDAMPNAIHASVKKQQRCIPRSRACDIYHTSVLCCSLVLFESLGPIWSQCLGLEGALIYLYPLIAPCHRASPIPHGHSLILTLSAIQPRTRVNAACARDHPQSTSVPANCNATVQYGSDEMPRSLAANSRPLITAHDEHRTASQEHSHTYRRSAHGPWVHSSIAQMYPLLYHPP